jgi:BirA family transcriptional regulator, biotin operon repressor / biotin---[acetyl-CoA-carboxylase] ligase
MGWLGHERVELAICDSTNDEAAALAARGAPHGTVVIARAQRAGRGRLGRVWHSPPGENLYLSCLLRPRCAPARVPPITLAAGLGVVDAVTAAGASAVLDWPNDVMLDSRKLAGILTEMSSRGQRVEHVITGVGVNLTTERFPPHLCEIATSLRLAGVEVEPEAFVTDLLAGLERWFDRFFAGGVPAIAPAWMERAGLRAGHQGKRVRATMAGGVPGGVPGGVIEGRVAGIDETGRLQIVADDGHAHWIVAGDVVAIPEGSSARLKKNVLV